MRQFLFAVPFLLFSSLASADNLTLGELKAQNAVRLGLEELKALLPNASVSYTTSEAVTVKWKNELDGKFWASSSNGHFNTGTSAKPGTWRIDDNGSYCVIIERDRSQENWCRYMFRVEDKYYGVNTKAMKNEKALALGFEFSK